MKAASSYSQCQPRRERWAEFLKCAVGSIFFYSLLLLPAQAQTESGPSEPGSCTFKNHVYTCDGAAFQPQLASARTVRVESQNSDGVARAQLTAFVSGKLGKAVAPQGEVPDLIFLLIPTGVEGVNMSPGEVDLGTLRVYTPASDGSRGQLVWAENFTGEQDLPWPIVVRGLIARFQSHFRIK